MHTHGFRTGFLLLAVRTLADRLSFIVQDASTQGPLTSSAVLVNLGADSSIACETSGETRPTRLWLTSAPVSILVDYAARLAGQGVDEPCNCTVQFTGMAIAASPRALLEQLNRLRGNVSAV